MENIYNTLRQIHTGLWHFSHRILSKLAAFYRRHDHKTFWLTLLLERGVVPWIQTFFHFLWDTEASVAAAADKTKMLYNSVLWVTVFALLNWGCCAPTLRFCFSAAPCIHLLTCLLTDLSIPSHAKIHAAMHDSETLEPDWRRLMMVNFNVTSLRISDTAVIAEHNVIMWLSTALVRFTWYISHFYITCLCSVRFDTSSSAIAERSRCRVG